MDTKVDCVFGPDGRCKVVKDGAIMGWVTKWHKRELVNETGVAFFSAKPVGDSPARHNCETQSSALAYLLECFQGQANERP